MNGVLNLGFLYFGRAASEISRACADVMRVWPGLCLLTPGVGCEERFAVFILCNDIQKLHIDDDSHRMA